MTDLGYQEEPGVVWELLDQGCIQGNSDYYDSYFQRSEFAPSMPPSPIGKHSTDRSYLEEQGTFAAPRVIQPSHEGYSEQDGWVRVHANDSAASPELLAVSSSGRNAEFSTDYGRRADRSVESDRRLEDSAEPDLGDLNMTQEERDFQHALMLQMEEDRLDQQARAEQGRIPGPHHPPHRAEPLHAERAQPVPPPARARGRAAQSGGCSLS